MSVLWNSDWPFSAACCAHVGRQFDGIERPEPPHVTEEMNDSKANNVYVSQKRTRPIVTHVQDTNDTVSGRGMSARSRSVDYVRLRSILSPRCLHRAGEASGTDMVMYTVPLAEAIRFVSLSRMNYPFQGVTICTFSWLAIESCKGVPNGLIIGGALAKSARKVRLGQAQHVAVYAADGAPGLLCPDGAPEVDASGCQAVLCYHVVNGEPLAGGCLSTSSLRQCLRLLQHDQNIAMVGCAALRMGRDIRQHDVAGLLQVDCRPCQGQRNVVDEPERFGRHAVLCFIRSVCIDERKRVQPLLSVEGRGRDGGRLQALVGPDKAANKHVAAVAAMVVKPCAMPKRHLHIHRRCNGRNNVWKHLHHTYSLQHLGQGIPPPCLLAEVCKDWGGQWDCVIKEEVVAARQNSLLRGKSMSQSPLWPIKRTIRVVFKAPSHRRIVDLAGDLKAVQPRLCLAARLTPRGVLFCLCLEARNLLSECCLLLRDELERFVVRGLRARCDGLLP